MTGSAARAVLLRAVLLATGMFFVPQVFAQEQTDDAVRPAAVGAAAGRASDSGGSGQPTSAREQPKQRNLRVKQRVTAEEKIKKEQFAAYTLGPGDVIEITVRRHTEFSGRFTIGSDRRIQYPFVGDVELAGLTKPQALERVREVLADYVSNPEIYVTILEYNSKQ
ncbi:MAG: polysaccharide biosynthesis/export family protein, partial [Candidatus Omnitrophica bacterium]|nr:polysaccharide biosynthesis/export family protein [Candidatus Omnitrophota bacterium]